MISPFLAIVLALGIILGSAFLGLLSAVAVWLLLAAGRVDWDGDLEGTVALIVGALVTLASIGAAVYRVWEVLK